MKLVKLNTTYQGEDWVIVLCYMNDELVHTRGISAYQYHCNTLDIRDDEINTMRGLLKKQNNGFQFVA